MGEKPPSSPEDGGALAQQGVRQLEGTTDGVSLPALVAGDAEVAATAHGVLWLCHTVRPREQRAGFSPALMGTEPDPGPQEPRSPPVGCRRTQHTRNQQSRAEPRPARITGP